MMKARFWSPCNVRLRLACAALLLTASAAPADSLWVDSSPRPMFADKRASAVGDVITILVQESSSTSKDANTKTSRKSSTDVSISQLFYGPANSGFLTKKGQYPGLKWDANNAYDGSGAVGSSEKIIARIAVRVIDVLPNRQLIVEGTRQTSFSGETQDVILRGIVRPEDVTAANTVYSYNVADVTIKFVSKGVVTDGQKKGWFSRLWDKVNPF